MIARNRSPDLLVRAMQNFISVSVLCATGQGLTFVFARAVKPGLLMTL